MIDFVIDSGNHKIKLAVFKNKSFKKLIIEEKLSDIENLIKTEQPGRLIISTVSNIDFSILNPKLNDWVPRASILYLTHETKLPVTVNYGSKSTLGVDRLAAVCGTWKLFPNASSLIIDAGTCITMDYLSKDGVFEGGIISPGFILRSKSMHDYTANLPIVSFETMTDLPLQIGSDTQSCLEAGVFWGLVYEINGFIKMLADKRPLNNIILTGGDCEKLESIIETDKKITVAPQLNIDGLYEILEYNA